MNNGPELWKKILRIARDLGGNPIIAGGAIRDYVLGLGIPKDIDVFLQGPAPDDPEIDNMVYDERQFNRFPEYFNRVGEGGVETIETIRQYVWEDAPCPIQFIWLEDNDPIQYVKRFDLGTSQCYYRGSVVLGKNFLHDWHHQTITILPHVFGIENRVERSRERAESLRRKYPNDAVIREEHPVEPIRLNEWAEEFGNFAMVNAQGLIQQEHARDMIFVGNGQNWELLQQQDQGNALQVLVPNVGQAQDAAVVLAENMPIQDDGDNAEAAIIRWQDMLRPNLFR